jgi:hypothetical protein
MKNLVLIITLCLSGSWLAAQSPERSNDITISLITGSPGKDLYAIFGHSAIRVRDDRTEQDILYNYGTFDFDTPNFYWKFMRGKLPYMLSVDRTGDLFRYYVREGRSITEQTLNLTDAQEEQLIQYLQWNHQPENRAYLYDFFYNNCATVIRDLLEQKYAVDYHADAVRDVTFRQLLDEKLAKAPWSDFGIDLILGLPADQKADFRHQMFLPDHLSQNLAKATMNGTPLIREQHTKTLVQKMPVVESNSMIPFTPLLFFIIIAALAFTITFTGSSRMKDIYDFMLFGILGIAGAFLLFMWFGTDHVATKNNWNVLWMNPLYLLTVIGIAGAQQFNRIRTLFVIYTVILLLLLLSWNWFPQQMNVAVIPIIIALIVRSLDRIGVIEKLFKKATSGKLQAAR